jgi:hypothetical protein
MKEVGMYYVIKGKSKMSEGFVAENIFDTSANKENPDTYWSISESPLDATIFDTQEDAQNVKKIIEKQNTISNLEVGSITMMYEKLK